VKFGTKCKIIGNFFQGLTGKAIDRRNVATKKTWNKEKRLFDEGECFQYLVKMDVDSKERWFAEFELEVMK